MKKAIQRIKLLLVLQMDPHAKKKPKNKDFYSQTSTNQNP